METNKELTILEKVSVVLKKVLIKIIEGNAEENDESFWEELASAVHQSYALFHCVNMGKKEFVGKEEFDETEAVEMLIEDWNFLTNQGNNTFSKALSKTAKGMFALFCASDYDPYSLEVVIEDETKSEERKDA